MITKTQLYFCLLIIIAIVSCKSTNTKDDFIGKYKIDHPSFDTTVVAQSMAEKTSDWVLVLEDHNNFQLSGTGINKVGYWTVENDGGQDFDLMMQSGDTVHARIDKKGIHLNHPSTIMDNIFRSVEFVRIDH